LHNETIILDKELFLQLEEGRGEKKEKDNIEVE